MNGELVWLGDLSFSPQHCRGSIYLDLNVKWALWIHVFDHLILKQVALFCVDLSCPVFSMLSGQRNEQASKHSCYQSHEPSLHHAVPAMLDSTLKLHQTNSPLACSNQVSGHSCENSN